MKERPIYLSGADIKRVKSQTITKIGFLSNQPRYETLAHGPKMWVWNPQQDVHVGEMHWHKYAPLGQPGDILWLKETWAINPLGTGWPYAYKLEPDTWYYHDMSGEWKSPVTMPRSASRMSLVVAGVEFKRIHDLQPEEYLGNWIPDDWKIPDTQYRDVDYKTLHPQDKLKMFLNCAMGSDLYSRNLWVCVSRLNIVR